jgi:ornithine cyclodeaminase/alanine dehydrogenase-like protein (mu-crystallin family)
MRRFLVRFIRPESFVHNPSSAAFTITTSGFEFSVHTTIKGASVVTLVTRASEPFLSAAMLGNDVHINALGAIFPTHAELQPSVLARADLVAVDNLVNTQQASRELREHFGENNSWHRVRTLGEMIASRSKRPVGRKAHNLQISRHGAL